MKRMGFIAWLLLYPLIEKIYDAIQWQFCERVYYSDDVKGWAAIISLCVYIFIARLLWSDASDQPKHNGE